MYPLDSAFLIFNQYWSPDYLGIYISVVGAGLRGQYQKPESLHFCVQGGKDRWFSFRFIQ